MTVFMGTQYLADAIIGGGKPLPEPALNSSHLLLTVGDAIKEHLSKLQVYAINPALQIPPHNAPPIPQNGTVTSEPMHLTPPAQAVYDHTSINQAYPSCPAPVEPGHYTESDCKANHAVPPAYSPSAEYWESKQTVNNEVSTVGNVASAWHCNSLLPHLIHVRG